MQPIVSRLAFRVYLIGVAQIAVIATGAAILWRAMLPSELPGPLRLSRYVADNVAQALGDPAALDGAIARARLVVASPDVFDVNGSVVVLTSPSDAPRCWSSMPADGATTTVADRFCFARRTTLRSGRPAYIAVKVPAWPPLSRVVPVGAALPLLIITISSLLLGRMLSGPMRQISSAARAFGAGNLEARVVLDRRDELGELADTFDDMADRVSDLLRAQRELMANISHELRTPLARIRVALDLAAEGDPDVARQSLKEIAGDLEELERLIGDVLTMARLDSALPSLPPLRRERIDVHDLVDRAAARFRSAHPERALRVENTSTTVAVDGDPVLLRRVLENLLENANKYTDRADEDVELRADADDGSVRIRVIDYGVGIAPEDLKRVFRPFFRADRSRTRATGGLGLGLALVRRIVEAHGGTVHLESGVGSGTTAVLRLPRLAEPRAASSEAVASAG